MPATPRRRRPANSARRWARDPDAKERALVAAFDSLLQEQGVHVLSVNEVVRRAGVGKSLLYAYFGGLEGLAAAWAARSDLLPGESELRGDDAAGYARLSTRAQLTRNYRRYARALRARPRTLELLGAELVAQTAVTRALDRVRTAHGRDLVRLFSRPDEYGRREVIALQCLMYAAICYLALRSRAAPRYFGLQLDRESDWRRIEAMLGLVIGRVVGGPRRGQSKRPASRKSTIGPSGRLR